MPTLGYALALDALQPGLRVLGELAATASGVASEELPLNEILHASRIDTDAIWIHLEEQPRPEPEVSPVLRDWVERGGRLVLTMAATHLLPLVGIVEGGIETEVREWAHATDPLWDPSFHDWPDYPHIRGVQGWGGHPLYDGLKRGTFSWAPEEGEPFARCVLRKPWGPSDGNVVRRTVGVDRGYVQLDATCAVAWEYEVGEGRVLCIGANVPLAYSSLRLEPQRRRLLVNALRYALSRETPTVTNYWPDGLTHARVSPLPQPRSLRSSFAGETPGDPAAYGGSAAPAIVTEAPDSSPLVLTTGGVSMIGSERHGLSEIWLRDLCVLGGGCTPIVDGEPLVAESVRISTERVDRQLRRSDGKPGTWKERWITSVGEGDAACSYELRGSESDSVQLSFEMPVRLQWPIPPGALTPLRSEGRHADGLGRVRVMGCDAQHGVELCVDGASELRWDDDLTRPRVTMTCAGNIQLTWRALHGSRAETAPGKQPVTDAKLLGDAQAARLRALNSRATRLISAGGVDEAWTWATHHLAALVAPSPFGDGRGLLAGVAASVEGWGISRPGYAWIFGRDTCWSIDAMLVAGLHEEAAACLRGLAATRDVTGKMAHEITLSGVVHYDAADASPLFLRALAAYWEWTGDVATVRELWPAVTDAFGFTCACDTDGDGLPENIGVGHGWVESGPLGGGDVTAYVAAIWIDALARIERVAREIGDVVSAELMASTHGRAVASLEALRDETSGRLALHRNKNGELLSTLTALSAVPVALGVEPERVAHAIVEVLSSERFASPWGVRMLSNTDPAYNPRGYHSGAVWPLYTGWLALACGESWRADLAATHILSNADLIRHRAKGSFDEVLHGDSGAAAGICPLQAWSAAMSISPIGLGLLGLRPSARAGSLTMRAQLPTSWESLRLQSVRIGTTRVDVSVARITGESLALVFRSSAPFRVTIESHAGEDVHIALEPGRDRAVTIQQPAGLRGEH